MHCSHNDFQLLFPWMRTLRLVVCLTCNSVIMWPWHDVSWPLSCPQSYPHPPLLPSVTLTADAGTRSDWPPREPHSQGQRCTAAERHLGIDGERSIFTVDFWFGYSFNRNWAISLFTCYCFLLYRYSLENPIDIKKCHNSDIIFRNAVIGSPWLVCVVGELSVLSSSLLLMPAVCCRQNLAFQADQRVKSQILSSVGTHQLFHLLSDRDIGVLMKTLGLLRNLLSNKPVGTRRPHAGFTHACIDVYVRQPQ